MAIQYYFDSLDPVSFQRLINALLVARFGESIRLLPLRGPDGGRDAEITSNVPIEVNLAEVPTLPATAPLKPGSYFFQVKHHRMAEHPPAISRATVVADFEKEISSNILKRAQNSHANYFFLITNVSSSKDAIAKIDEKRRHLLQGVPNLHADVWWQDQIVAWLDQTPKIWKAFPEIFAGQKVPSLGLVADSEAEGLPRSIRLAVRAQALRDGFVRFRQINLEHSLARLFVDINVETGLSSSITAAMEASPLQPSEIVLLDGTWAVHRAEFSCIQLLLAEHGEKSKRFILEGGPGQGKSTATQVLAQLYRSVLLQAEDEYKRIISTIPKARFPFRIELRLFAEWLAKEDGSVEQYLATIFARDAGGGQITVEDVHSIAEGQPITLIFDGLDEVGSDDLRDIVIKKIMECIERMEDGLKADIHTIITSRPPAIAGRASKLLGFERVRILPLSDEKIADYVQRWSEAQCSDWFERDRVIDSFNKRKNEQHVHALIKNPMQLTVLLHFIRLKGEAFPDRRAELYREYFKTVIDRDVEKSRLLREKRRDIETLHEVIGFEVHSRAESNRAVTSLSHDELMKIVKRWLTSEGRKDEIATDLFRLGEERLGLIVALKGEGTETRYGFEVQPVREYFAAAFINDNCDNAHEMFQAMVIRPIWREVALFLAGLRRANEKADLISRAKALDDDRENGWRSQGKAIVLQLLQEGVLTSPGHVHRDAVSYLLSTFDPLKSSPRSEPPNLLASLPKLIKSCENDYPRQVLRQFLERSNATQDRYILMQLWRTAYRVLDISDIEKALKGRINTAPAIAPLLHLLWPAEASLTLPADHLKQVMPTSPPTAIWAQSFYRAGLLDAKIRRLDISVIYHELLFEQFAFQPLMSPRDDLSNIVHPDTPTPFAIWTLATNMIKLGFRLGGLSVRPSAPAKIVTYDGLSDDSKQVVQRLILTSAEAIEGLCQDKTPGRALRNLLQTIDELLGAGGLHAWVACRCALVIMQYVEARQYTMIGGVFEVSNGNQGLANSRRWQTLRRRLTPFFRAYIHKDFNRTGKTFAYKITKNGLHRSIPSHVPINGKFESVPMMVAKEGAGDAPSAFSWVERVPIPHYWMPEIIRNDRSLRGVSSLSGRSLIWDGPRARFRKREIRMLYEAALQSEDPAVQAGLLFSILSPKVMEIAAVAGMLEIIGADATVADMASHLFEFGIRFGVPANLIKLAEAVVHQTSQCSRSTSTAAAQLLAHTLSNNLSPLRALEIFPATLRIITE